MKVNLAIVPFLAWFAVGGVGTYLSGQIRPSVGSDIAANVGLLVFLFGGILAYSIKEKLHL